MQSSFLDRISRAVCRDLLAFPLPAKLDRAAFVARYLPQYVRAYEAPRGIRLNARGRPMMGTPATYSAQITKREHRIDEAFALYVRTWESQRDFDARSLAQSQSSP